MMLNWKQVTSGVVRKVFLTDNVQTGMRACRKCSEWFVEN